MENKWFYISKESEENDNFSLNDKHLEFPFEYLPKEERLTPKDLNRLKQLESEDNGFKDGGEFYEMVRLRYRRGPALYFHKERRKKLNSIPDECSKLNIKLPSNFIKLMKSDKYVSRLRLGFGAIDLSDGIVLFDNSKEKFIITFIKDSQDCCFWYLMIDKYGNHKVLFNFHHWSNHLKIVEENDASFEYFICANSIEYFIARLSYDIKIKEENR